MFGLFSNGYGKVPTKTKQYTLHTDRSHHLTMMSEEYYKGNKDVGPPYKYLEHCFAFVIKAKLIVIDGEERFVHFDISGKDGTKHFSFQLKYSSYFKGYK